MALLTRSSVSNTSKSTDPAADFQKNDSVIFPTGSVFIGGKITDNIGAFTQITIDKYAFNSSTNSYYDQIGADNMDFRYADRFVSPGNDLIVGVSLNNNPSVSDPWNTAPAWMQYVPVPSPTSSSFIDGNAPYPGYASSGNLAGITAYTYWNQTLYGEIGSYHTSKHLFHFMSAGATGSTLKGFNPYWRLAYTKQWGAHYLMLGTSGMVANVYDNTSDPAVTDHYRDVGLDAQYQFLLDPHSVTMQLAYMHERHRYPDSAANQPATYFDAAGNPLANTNAVDTTNILRAKLTYVYEAKYGGSLGFFNRTGSTNTNSNVQTAGYDSTGVLTAASDVASANLSGNPGTRGVTYEAFWTPIQYARIGLQYLLQRRGPMSMAPSQLGVFTRSSERYAHANVQFHVQPLSLDAFGEPLHAFDAFTASVCNLNPASRGSVTLRSADFRDAPAIAPNYLSTDEDRQVAADSLRLARRIVQQPALAGFAPQEYKPGVQYQSDDELARLAGDIATTIFHPAGTTAMGRADDARAVVDSHLRVLDGRGGVVRGLRVVDAGVMPTIPSGNINSPTLMIAEKAARWIAADA
ncbi:oxygen-dependent choline dehydrogenase [mine drainage metagenome]|uniref:Oxygen-dependent choline dehydrogenase n=1 Tax=mine drainage metagenome TaxID=410659 RepID=A0A1J5PMW6_9ZZZZ